MNFVAGTEFWKFAAFAWSDSGKSSRKRLVAVAWKVMRRVFVSPNSWWSGGFAYAIEDS